MNIRKFFSLLLILTMILIYVPACGSEGGSSSTGPKSLEILDTAYVVDKETGDYLVAGIIQNNADSAVSQASFRLIGRDKDGNAVKPFEDSEGTVYMAPMIGVLEPGQKTAWVESNLPFGDGANIWTYFQDIPETVEWKFDEVKAASGKEPLGLSIADYTFDGTETSPDGQQIDKFSVTLKNEGETECSFEPGAFLHPTENGEFTLDIIAVYRDDEGKIVGATHLFADPQETVSLSAGESAVCPFINIERHYEGEPELYLNIDFMEAE